MSQVLADLVLVLHLAFLVFVAAGGLLVRRWPGLAWVHVPAVLWGAIVELAGWVCPLTPLENALRARAGTGTSHTDFVARYLLPIVYPEGLSRPAQVMLGVLVLVVNGGVYAWTWHGPRKSGSTKTGSTPARR